MIAEILHKIPIVENQGKDTRFYTVRASLASLPASKTITGTRCTRQMVYNRLGFTPSEMAGRSYFIFDDSSWHEELTKDWIRKSPFKIHSEQLHVNINLNLDYLITRKCHCGEIIPEDHVAGHMDGILQDVQGGEYLWEHKAISHFVWQSYRNKNEIPWDYIAQCCVYAKGLREQYKLEMNGIVLTMKNKNSSQYLDYEMVYNNTTDTVYFLKMTFSDKPDEPYYFPEGYCYENITGQIAFKFQMVEDCAQKKIIPKREYTMDDWQCQLCRFQKPCYEKYLQEFQELSVDFVVPEDAVIGYIDWKIFIEKYKITKDTESRLKKENEADKKTLTAYLESNEARTARLPSGDIVERNMVHRDAYSVESIDYETLKIKEPKKQKGEK